MDIITEPIKSVLKFITEESGAICRLCLDSIETGGLALDDDARLTSPYFEGDVAYSEMLLNLGVKEEPSMPYMLCPKCASHITQAYLFQKLVQHSYHKWEEVILKIHNVLDLSNQLRHNSRSVYFFIGDNENKIFTSHKSSTKTKPAVMSKVRAFIMQKKCKKKAKAKPKPQVICEECGDGFSSNFLLAKHQPTHSNDRCPCPECPKVFKTIWSLKDHRERQHSPKNIQCPKCSKMLSTERLLRMHDDHEHKAAICTQCFIQFPSKKALTTHMNKHEQLLCPQCERIFRNKQSFHVHQKTCGQPNKMQRVYCDICNQGFARKNALRTHLKIKHKFSTKVFSCNWCDKEFDAISRLKNHIVKHTKEKNFHCEKCGGMFVTQAALVYHIRLHTGEKPYKCDMCPESFLSASRRMEHKRRKHLGPHKQCPYCESKFITGHCLRTHIARHKNPLSKLFIGDNDKQAKPELTHNKPKILHNELILQSNWIAM